MACVGASAARALALFYETDAMAQDQANSRIYGGIHCRFDNEASQATCVRVPEFVFANYMRPRH